MTNSKIWSNTSKGINTRRLNISKITIKINRITNKIENSTIQEHGHGIHQVFSPIDKVVELYERLLESEKEKIRILLNKKK